MIFSDCFYYGFVAGLFSSVISILIFFATSSKNFYRYLSLKKEMDVFDLVKKVEYQVKELQKIVYDINKHLYEIVTAEEQDES